MGRGMNEDNNKAGREGFHQIIAAGLINPCNDTSLSVRQIKRQTSQVEKHMLSRLSKHCLNIN